jgi:hypothetical protein
MAASVENMSVREAINRKKSVGYGFAAAFALGAIAVFVATQWPQHKMKGDKVFYTDDDGQSWFLDSTYRTPPYTLNGKTAVRAMVYSYDHGSKTFCAYLQRYIPDSKKRLDDAVADAARHGKGPETVGLFSDRGIMKDGTEVKLPGPGHQWVVIGTIDGSNTVNDGMAAHADDTTDLIIPN